MRTIIISVMLLFGFNKCFAQSDSLPISITLKIDKEYLQTLSKKSYLISTEIKQNGYVVKSDSIKQKYFDVSLKIKNKSDRTIKIWLMTCGWEDNFIVNNNYISIQEHECDKTIPTLVEFKSGETKTYTNTLIKSIKFDYPCKSCIYGTQVETTKIGLIIIDDIFRPKLEMFNYDNAMKDKSKWKIVWSNPLFLLTKNERNPKPMQIPVR